MLAALSVELDARDKHWSKYCTYSVANNSCTQDTSRSEAPRADTDGLYAERSPCELRPGLLRAGLLRAGEGLVPLLPKMSWTALATMLSRAASDAL